MTRKTSPAAMRRLAAIQLAALRAKGRAGEWRTCAVCGGDGYLVTENPTGRSPAPCRYCKGEGRVKP